MSEEAPTASSGVVVQPHCVNVFNEIKLSHRFRYVIYCLTDDLREITVLKTGPPSCSYHDFVAALKESESVQQCRYGVFEAEYDLRNGQKGSKLVFFLWSPECASIRQKMLYASSKDVLKKRLIGMDNEMQACDHGDLAWTNVLDKLHRSEAKRYVSEFRLLVGFT